MKLAILNIFLLKKEAAMEEKVDLLFQEQAFLGISSLGEEYEHTVDHNCFVWKINETISKVRSQLPLRLKVLR
ncbi:hypothetical protein L1765_07340 [Microaerobacter geothermalis]|uniref:hypothetical protein n=1 Tax=Microaerobacter geothermalis TaxID=674972 RepID=UPI001F28CFBA|nr:hypothetical protein [Microaerobacter geothermalis]MCF6093793.1 hypothetical protein [Microaerobacter geothermalis]